MNFTFFPHCSEFLSQAMRASESVLSMLLSLLALTSFVACKSDIRESPGKPQTSVRTPTADADSPVTLPSLLVELAGRFTRGTSASTLAKDFNGAEPEQSGRSWTVHMPQQRLDVTVVADSKSQTSDWMIVTPVGDEYFNLGEVVQAFGTYRKLPSGEYTSMIFDNFDPKVLLSARVLAMQPETESKVVHVQFQKAN